MICRIGNDPQRQAHDQPRRHGCRTRPVPLTQEETPHAHPLRRHPSGGDAPRREGGRRPARLTADTSRPPRGRPRPQEWLDQRFVPPPADGERLEHDEGVAGAETKEMLARRVYAAMDEIVRRPCEHQVIVTHGGSLTFVVASWIRMPIQAVGQVGFPVPSGSITTLREDDSFHNRAVVGLGDIRHLGSAESEAG
ncbi:histidine phosphatase family protein [Nonomuraea fuscirosea]|uniref:histidine phosphatase family protein n=1 Tax=Nonomuraea fuscirosea TaxID=1291556 RepID=UPI002481B9FA|nr:histidine phosphatase family protein [Nonomuraea fuscirosea]